MSPELVELALRKQRLQLKSADLRTDFVRHTRTFTPLFHGIDRVADSLRWARDNAPLLSGLGVFLLVARPRTVLRWARRGWFGWQLVRRVRRFVS